MPSALDCSLLKCNFAMLKRHLHEKLAYLSSTASASELVTLQYIQTESTVLLQSTHSSQKWRKPLLYRLPICFQNTNVFTFCRAWFDQVQQFTLGARIFTDNRFSGHKKKQIWIPAAYFPAAWSLFMPLCSWDGCLWCSHCSLLGAKCTGPPRQAQAVIHLPTRCQEVIKIKTPFLDVAFY